MTDKRLGKLVIISGPSGAGKSTIVKKLISDCPLPLKLSVSATTRPIRADDRPLGDDGSRRHAVALLAGRGLESSEPKSKTVNFSNMWKFLAEGIGTEP